MSNSNKDSEIMENQKEETKHSIDKGRRRFGKAGVAAPILMTLASQPAFGWGGGMQCMSNMMSGNLSDPSRGNCDLGWSPGGWCNPGGKVNNMDTIWAWNSTTFEYGTYDPAATYGPQDKICGIDKQNESECYSGGATIGSLPAGINANNFGSNTTLRDIICKTGGTGPSANDTRHCVAAYLNASLPGINYILTQQQVIDLCDGTLAVPGGISLKTFLDSTWQ
ncbi:MAG: hypothetical protein COB62_01635 [Piscirickettsiaceae bacterium]|nr:MAG: hypothetical protein COB62_01635 [Piscirickettsiaceae bacterium]